MYVSTASVIKYNPFVRRNYIHTKEQGMSGNKLMVTYTNRLLNIIYSIMKNNIDFRHTKIVNRRRIRHNI